MGCCISTVVIKVDFVIVLMVVCGVRGGGGGFSWG